MPATLDLREKSFLATYRLPRPTFASPGGLPAVLAPTWWALAEGRTRDALEAGHAVLREGALEAPYQAALQSALAWAHLMAGSPSRARTFALEARAADPAQWLAWRALFETLLATQDYQAAAALADGFEAPAETAPWDEALPDQDRYLALAASAWLIGSWDRAARYLSAAYPGGVARMPVPLQEDWFLLAFYREAPEDAAAAAGRLIADRTTDAADILLQTLVKQGWNSQALTLYRTLYDRHPGNELLRRRLVGLCIREGDVTGARKLMERGALKLTAS